MYFDSNYVLHGFVRLAGPPPFRLTRSDFTLSSLRAPHGCAEFKSPERELRGNSMLRPMGIRRGTAAADAGCS